MSNDVSGNRDLSQINPLLTMNILMGKPILWDDRDQSYLVMEKMTLSGRHQIKIRSLSANYFRRSALMDTDVPKYTTVDPCVPGCTKEERLLWRIAPFLFFRFYLKWVATRYIHNTHGNKLMIFTKSPLLCKVSWQVLFISPAIFPPRPIRLRISRATIHYFVCFSFFILFDKTWTDEKTGGY